jgi:cysteinyl-tRNA synthetase
MPLKLYNTLSRSVAEFQPLEPGRVGMYGCGPTVYQLPHIGNYRSFLLYDLLHRYLEWKGFQVKFVMNLTDVDDRTINAAAAGGVPLADITEPLAAGFFDELRTLGVRPADVFPRATRHVPQMVELIGRLLEAGHAYVAEQGDVYFDIGSFPAYGRLSRLDAAAVREGAGLEQRERATDEPGKRDARDFALWKAARPADRQVGAVWTAPWGEGRPGWHIECSVMSMAELGDGFDIHLGGEDLVFPHHEDEIAQSEAATGQPFARWWIHVKFLKIDQEKMSKSLGNVVRLSDLLERDYTPAAIRYLLLSGHYRRELSFSFDGLHDGQAAVRRLLDFQARLDTQPTADDAAPSTLPEIAGRALAAFEDALDDDLNTPAALAALFTFVREVNSELDRVSTVSPGELREARASLGRMDDVLGVLEVARARATVDDEFARWVEERVAERQAARARRDFAAADAIRDELAAAGVVVEDTPQGPRWKKT